MASKSKKLSHTTKVETKAQVNEDFIDLDLSATKKKRFRFDKDDSRIVEINTSDVNSIGRLQEGSEKLTELLIKASNIMGGKDEADIDAMTDEEAETTLKSVSAKLKEIDLEMRNIIDFIFDASVSAAAAPTGSMYDPFEGSFRFEYVLDVLIPQYTDNLKYELTAVEKNMQKHTSKYIP